MKCSMEAARLLISVVRRGRGDFVAALSRQAGARGGTIVFGRGSGTNAVLRILGLTDTAKELVFTIATEAEVARIKASLVSAPDLCRKAPGIGFVIDVNSFVRSVALADCGSGNAEDMTRDFTTGEARVDKTSHELICAIVNAGLADDLMHVARKAGARGGTILKARGTATGEDSSFFGITIVPEKEFLMILASRKQSDCIADAVAGAECLAEPGSGVVFRMPVEDFFQLGARARS